MIVGLLVLLLGAADAPIPEGTNQAPPPSTSAPASPPTSAPASPPVVAPAPQPVAAPAPPPVAAPAPAPHPDRSGLPDVVRDQLECLDENAAQAPEVIARRHRVIPPSYLLRIRALGGGFAGGDSKLKSGSGATANSVAADYGYTVAGTASLGLLHPLELDAGVRYLGGGQSSALQLDATAALSFRTYGNRWVEAGFTEGGGIVHSWGAHCQLRRIDNQLFGGVKVIRETLKDPSASRTLPALQLGFASHHLAGSAVDFSLAALWSPSRRAYGGQLSFGASRLLIAVHIPVDWIYTSMSMGGLFGETVANWWATLDLGVALEL